MHNVELEPNMILETGHEISHVSPLAPRTSSKDTLQHNNPNLTFETLENPMWDTENNENNHDAKSMETRVEWLYENHSEDGPGAVNPTEENNTEGTQLDTGNNISTRNTACVHSTKILVWNVQREASLAFMWVLQEHLRMQEPLVAQLMSFATSLAFKDVFGLTGFQRGIWLCWNPDFIQVSLLKSKPGGTGAWWHEDDQKMC
ncbi:hypothetical protein Cgig2_028295 [Carnegiea gigantea]|uniref:Uncharacterized protein n=1 Tax=Carnegiea gigantea TaxID=171969 RepID=A0A9Q1GT91_9CARY|nr:hypothetical protein Cgig2_028295 [Carnegiea gigantea]